MDFIEWMAAQPVVKGPRGVLINDARAVLRYGGRGEFEDRIRKHRASHTVQTLRKEWEEACREQHSTP